MPEQAFSKSLRLLNASEFQNVFNNNLFRASHQHLLILAAPNQLSHPRLGLVIAKKNIRLAVQRNRVKRLARESFRLQQQALGGIDVIILARRGLDQLDNPAIHKLLQQQWRRIEKKHKASLATPSSGS